MKYTRWIAVIVAATAVVVAFQNCSTNGYFASSNSTASASDSLTSNPQINAKTLTMAETLGTWTSPCVQNGSASYIGTFEFLPQGLFVFTGPFYGNTACTMTPDYRLTIRGNYWLGNLNPSVTTATNTGTMITSIGITPSTSSVANSMNAGQFCGLTNWTSGLENSVNPTAACLQGLPQISTLSMMQISDDDELLFGSVSAADFNSGVVYSFEGAEFADIAIPSASGPLTPAKLAGTTWITPCHEGTTQGTYLRSAVSFPSGIPAGMTQLNVALYSNSNCTTGTSLLQSSAVITLGLGTGSPNIPGATLAALPLPSQVSWQVSASPAEVLVLNANAACGNSWSVSQSAIPTMCLDSLGIPPSELTPLLSDSMGLVQNVIYFGKNATDSGLNFSVPFVASDSLSSL